jgi:hypothetical protein
MGRISALFFLFSVTALAYPKHELVTGTAPLVGFAGQTTGSSVTFNAGTTISVSAGYQYAIVPGFQIGLNGSVFHLSTADLTVLQFLVGPTLNIPLGSRAIYDTLYLTFRGGIVDGTATEGAIEGEVGVRIRLVEHVTYRPGFGVLKILDGSDALFIVRPVQFGFHF